MSRPLVFGSKTTRTWKIPPETYTPTHIFALTYHPSLTPQILLLIYIYIYIYIYKVFKSPLFSIHQELNILLIFAHLNPLTSIWQMILVTLNFTCHTAQFTCLRQADNWVFNISGPHVLHWSQQLQTHVMLQSWYLFRENSRSPTNSTSFVPSSSVPLTSTVNSFFSALLAMSTDIPSSSCCKQTCSCIRNSLF